MEMWFSDEHTDNVKLSIRVDKQLFSAQSEFQRIDVLESKEFGKILVTDGDLMLTEKDEFIYHEMMAHVPMAVHPKVENVLVIGGGDGGCVRELAKYNTIQKIDVVEVDPLHLAVLRARIQNLLRMTAKEDKSVYEDARFRFDFAKLYYQKDGQTVVLSNTEQKLLKLLVDNQKTTLSRQMLIDRVWTDGAEYVDENALSVAISRLRNKLEDTLSRPMFIQNVYGIGYVWQPAKEKTWRG